MRQKKHTKVQRTLTFLKITHHFREPYKASDGSRAMDTWRRHETCMRCTARPDQAAFRRRLCSTATLSTRCCRPSESDTLSLLPPPHLPAHAQPPMVILLMAGPSVMKPALLQVGRARVAGKAAERAGEGIHLPMRAAGAAAARPRLCRCI